MGWLAQWKKPTWLLDFIYEKPYEQSQITCFPGEPKQRLRLEFRDFDLFYGGAHCPFDFVTIYDGPDKLAEKIGTYCGQLRNLVIYSTKNMMWVFQMYISKILVGIICNWEMATKYPCPLSTQGMSRSPHWKGTPQPKTEVSLVSTSSRKASSNWISYRKATQNTFGALSKLKFGTK